MRFDSPPRFYQSGISLLVSLVMLVVLTLIVVSAVMTSNLGLRIAGNAQIRQEAVTAAQMVIDSKLDNLAYFNGTDTDYSESVDINGDGTIDYSVTLNAPTCLELNSVPGYSAPHEESAPRDTLWDIEAEVENLESGLNMVVHQGVKVRVQVGTFATECDT